MSYGTDPVPGQWCRARTLCTFFLLLCSIKASNASLRHLLDDRGQVVVPEEYVLTQGSMQQVFDRVATRRREILFSTVRLGKNFEGALTLYRNFCYYIAGAKALRHTMILTTDNRCVCEQATPPDRHLLLGLLNCKFLCCAGHGASCMTRECLCILIWLSQNGQSTRLAMVTRLALRTGCLICPSTGGALPSSITAS